MGDVRRIKDIMFGIFEYPHIPYWFSIGQAIKIIRISYRSGSKYSDPVAVLIFDEKYNLLGTLSLVDIMKSLGPYLPDTSPAGADGVSEEERLTRLFAERAGKRIEEQASSIMTPAKVYCAPEDSIFHAADLIIRNDLILLPVLEKKRKLVGLVRAGELFEEVSKLIVQQ
jgi:hypothetical protein